MDQKLLASEIALPEFTEDTDTIVEYAARWLKDRPPRERERILRIFRSVEVNRRYSIMSIDQVFSTASFKERNDTYIEKSTDLAEEALRLALEKAGLEPRDIDLLITISCTGIMIPSVDAVLVNRLRMRKDVVRLPVTEMGCAGGVSGLIYAHSMLRSCPGKTAAVVAVESPTSTFQLEDYSMTNAVCAAIFGDGAACAVLAPAEEVRPVILDTQMYHFYDALHLMGFDLRDSGFHIFLDPGVPASIEKSFPEIIFPFLERNGLTIEEVDHFVFHPGGKKIIQIVEDLLGRMGKNLEDTREVMRSYGNMSSATVLYVMNRFLAKPIASGEYGMMLSFGPGFSAQALLMQWK